MFLLTMYPHITGHWSRLPVLEQPIRHMKAKGECWFARHAGMAAGVGDNVRMLHAHHLIRMR